MDNWQWRANSGNESNRTNGTDLARSACKMLRIVAGKCAMLRESSRKFAQIRPVIPRCLASQARHKLDAPSGLFACAKRGRIVTGGTLFNHGWKPMNTDSGRGHFIRKAGKQEETRNWLPKPATRWMPEWGSSLTRNVVANGRELGRDYEQEETKIDRERTQGTQRIPNPVGETPNRWRPGRSRSPRPKRRVRTNLLRIAC